LKKVRDHKHHIKLDHPKELKSMSCKHMELIRAKWTGRTSLWEMWNTPTHVFKI